MRRTPLWSSMLLGAAAGALGTWLMGIASKWIPSPPRAQKPAHEDMDANATEVAVEKLARPLGLHLDGERRKKLGLAVHWTYGALWGAAYGAIASHVRLPPVVTGFALGAGLWLFGDEIAVPAFHLSRRATEYPAEVHARALASHLAYGAGTDAMFRFLIKGSRYIH